MNLFDDHAFAQIPGQLAMSTDVAPTDVAGPARCADCGALVGTEPMRGPIARGTDPRPLCLPCGRAAWAAYMD